MRFEPKKYLNELVAGRESGLVKIIMGVRRCGKSFLLLGLISIGGILCSCQVKTDWREKPLASDLQFTQLARSWDEGIPLGNATVGALLWQRDSALRFPWTVPTFGTFDLWIVSLDPTTVSRGYIVKCKRGTIYRFRRNTTGLMTSCLLLRKYQELPLSFLWKNWVSLTTYVCI